MKAKAVDDSRRSLPRATRNRSRQKRSPGFAEAGASHPQDPWRA